MKWHPQKSGTTTHGCRGKHGNRDIKCKRKKPSPMTCWNVYKISMVALHKNELVIALLGDCWHFSPAPLYTHVRTCACTHAHTHTRLLGLHFRHLKKWTLMKVSAIITSQSYNWHKSRKPYEKVAWPGNGARRQQRRPPIILPSSRSPSTPHSDQK